MATWRIGDHVLLFLSYALIYLVPRLAIVAFGPECILGMQYKYAQAGQVDWVREVKRVASHRDAIVPKLD